MKRTALLLALALASCGKSNNSKDTDQASENLRKAQAEVTEKSKLLATTESDIERKKRALAEEQQALATTERSVETTRQQLGSARGTLDEARSAYGVAATQRLAKLDATLAALAAKSDAASRDAVIGARARRDVLAIKLGEITATTEPRWASYTREVDTIFDAIERDLRPADR